MACPKGGVLSDDDYFDWLFIVQSDIKAKVPSTGSFNGLLR